MIGEPSDLQQPTLVAKPRNTPPVLRGSCLV